MAKAKLHSTASPLVSQRESAGLEISAIQPDEHGLPSHPASGGLVSRRSIMNMIAKSVAAIATASAGAVGIPDTAKASTNTLTPKSGPIPPGEPLLIEKLWAEREALMCQIQASKERRDELEAVLLRRLPKPHASIVFSPENDADGLQYPNSGEPHTPHSYIWPSVIETALATIKPSRWENTTIDDCLAVVERKEPLPLSTEKTGLRDRLSARLDLSTKYERKIKRTRKEIGLAAAAKEVDRLYGLLIQLDKRIMSQKATTRPTFAIKLAIWRNYGEDIEEAESIVRDVQYLVELPGAVGGAWAFDPNEEIDKARARKS